MNVERDQSDDAECVVALAPLAQDDARLSRAYAGDLKLVGRPRNLTRAAIASPTTWQALIRSEHMFATLRRIDGRTCALLCVYTSLLNGCAYCLDDAAAEAVKLGVEAETLLTLPDLPEEQNDPRLLLGLRYARQVALHPASAEPALGAELRAAFDDEELLELTAVLSAKCFWNRFAMSLRLPPEGYAEPALLQGLLQRSRELGTVDVSR